MNHLELNALEKAVIEKYVRMYTSKYPWLSKAYTNCVVINRTLTGVGSYTDFIDYEQFVKLHPIHMNSNGFELTDVLIQINNKILLTSVLVSQNKKILQLELVTFGEKWDGTWNIFELK